MTLTELMKMDIKPSWTIAVIATLAYLVAFWILLSITLFAITYWVDMPWWIFCITGPIGFAAGVIIGRHTVELVPWY